MILGCAYVIRGGRSSKSPDLVPPLGPFSSTTQRTSAPPNLDISIPHTITTYHPFFLSYSQSKFLSLGVVLITNSACLVATLFVVKTTLVLLWYKFALQMATHGPINGVKISRECHCTSISPGYYAKCWSCCVGISALLPGMTHQDDAFDFLCQSPMNLTWWSLPPAIDDPHKVVKVIASDGKSGETREISYSNCKVIGNGSFGVVFQAKLVGGPKEGDDIAIKKVLQDKRFKVCYYPILAPDGSVSDLMFRVSIPTLIMRP